MSKEKTVEDYKKHITSAIEESSDGIVNVLKETIKAQFNPRIERLDFEMFQNSTSLDIVMFSYTKDFNGVYNEKGEEKYFTGDKDIWEGLIYFPENDEFDFDNFNDTCEKPDTVWEDAVVEWFGKCWDKAGGDKINIPTYIERHDTSFYFNLKSKKWEKGEA